MSIIQQLTDFKKTAPEHRDRAAEERKNNIYINNIKSDSYIK
jgi:hypothetical protein